MAGSVEIKDDMNSPLNALLDKYEASAGTDRNGSMRDVLTELRHMCDQLGMSFNDLLQASHEVYEEHLALEELA